MATKRKPGGGKSPRKTAAKVRSKVALRKSIKKDQAELQKIIKSPAFKKHRVITPGSRAGVLQARLKAKRKGHRNK